ncbi:MAG TPA: methyltransferase [Methyloceanibacter sp.]|nr:methyltransferase [Methyloceanibacter sp.]
MSQAGKDVLEERLTRAIEAYHEAALLYAAVKLGLAEAMGTRAWTPETLAAALGLFAPHLARFLRGLCIVGICEERADGSFALTPLGQSLTSGSRLAQKVQIVVEQYWQPWASLTSTLQTGTPAFAQTFGASVFDWRRDHAEQGAMFASYLAKTTQAETEAILAALDVAETDRVVEIGGADIFPATLPANADLYVLQGVLQNCADEDAAAILHNCRAALRDGARLVIVERLRPERATDDPAAVMLDLHMMTITGGRARSFAEIETLLSRSRFKLSGVTATGRGLSVIEAI